jgi:D-3-phosphoglycerate dehydrogenase
MNVVIWASEGSREPARADGWTTADSKAKFFENCDVISLHVRLYGSTRRGITAEDLSRLKPTSLLVNTSRAALIEEGALEDALVKGRPGMAAVDVFEEEPIWTPDHHLLKLENAFCTPNIGYGTREKYETHFSAIFDQVLAFKAGSPINVINPKVLR